jgi:hypothetical protein
MLFQTFDDIKTIKLHYYILYMHGTSFLWTALC